MLLAGATGLIGRECLRLLVADPAFERVVLISRRPVTPEVHAPKVESRIVDFEQLASAADLFGVDAIICALGTTIKEARTPERFRRVDLDYPLILARIGLERGVRHFLLVSALGANPRSRIFYNRVKGELEAAVLALPYPGITIVRPSLLLGTRPKVRLGEAIAKRFRFLPLGRYQPIEASTVAATLIRAAKGQAAGSGGQRIIESREMRATRNQA